MDVELYYFPYQFSIYLLEKNLLLRSSEILLKNQIFQHMKVIKKFLLYDKYIISSFMVPWYQNDDFFTLKLKSLKIFFLL